MDLAAELRDNGGFTYNPRLNTLVRIGERDGYAIAIPGTEREIKPGESVISAVQRLVQEFVGQFHMADYLYIGGWYSEERGVDVIELTEIHDKRYCPRGVAVFIGAQRNQEGILDMRTGEFIPTGGMGDVQV